jgi:hypothetical protein
LLPEVYWKYTLNDIRVATRLYLGRQQALIVQDFDTMAILLSQAFGSKKKSGKVNKVKSKAGMQQALKGLLG